MIETKVVRPHFPLHNWKVTKAEAGYEAADDVRCKECAFITEDGKCTHYPKSEEDVKAFGSCDDWQPLSEGRIVGNRSGTRVRTNYEENKEGFGCRRCEYMRVNVKDCKKVDRNSPGDTPGKIIGMACCRLWDPDEKRAKMTDAELVRIMNAA